MKNFIINIMAKFGYELKQSLKDTLEENPQQTLAEMIYQQKRLAYTIKQAELNHDYVSAYTVKQQELMTLGFTENVTTLKAQFKLVPSEDKKIPTLKLIIRVGIFL